MSEEIREGDLNKNYEVIILPHDSPGGITGMLPENSRYDPEEYPEAYRSGIGEEGIDQLKQFVLNGGTLVALGDSYEFAVEEFDLDVENSSGGYDDT